MKLTLSILVTVAIAILGLNCRQTALALDKVEKLQRTVTVIQANYLTAEDKIILWTKYNDPPEWFIDRVDRLEARLINIEARLK